MIRVAELDGIPVLVAPGSGPARAGISFRVGYGDEILARSGITHLIEHLALHRLGVTDYHYNGTTAPFFTTFVSQGSPESVATYLERTCDALADLPLERLETEKDVLRTEAEGRTHSVADRLWLWRHGARGAGLAALPEWGLYALRPEDLVAWVARYFTCENAVLWFSGMEQPPNLRLALPSGRRQPLPDIPDILPSTPAYFPELNQKIGYHVRVPRSSAAWVCSTLLQRELFRRMRQANGYSYTLATDYSPLDANRADILAMADIAEDRQEAALGEFIDVLATMRWGEFDPAELAEIRSRSRAELTNPHIDAARLPGEACDLLVGGALLQTDELIDEAAAVTLADVRRVAEEAAAGALLLTPRGLTADWAGFTIAPAWSDAPAQGQPIPANGDPERALVIGPDGVSETVGGNPVTVAFADCQAMLAWPDGGRLLVGGDGISCGIEPTLYPLNPTAIGYLDERVPPELVVRMPARPADAIPAPPAPAPAPAPVSAPAEGGRPTAAGRWSMLGIVVLIVVLLLFLLFALTATSMVGTADDEDGAMLVVSIMFWVVVAICGGGIWGLARLRRRR